MTKLPSITVIMPVFNTGKFVKDAIQSILDQSFSDFEFIVINDGSTDESLEIIKTFSDKRIKILNNASNVGNYPSRNRGLRIAKGKYICVMDADDTAFPNRFERQFIFMEENPDIGLAGSGFRYFGKEQDIFRENDFERIKVSLLRNNCFIHPTLIMRHEFLKKYNLRYNEKYYYSADYDLIVRAAGLFLVTNILEILLNYRIHDQQITMKNRAKQMQYADEIAIQQLKYIGIDPVETETQLHINLLKGNSIEYSKKQELYDWIKKILTANQNKKYYQMDELESFFNSLLSKQPFCNAITKTNLKTELTEKNEKLDLTDVTFLIRLRIDSMQRFENTNTVIRFITSHFKTNISILEVDGEQQYFPEIMVNNVRYRFVEDKNEIFHKTRWANQMISDASTPYVAVWDADAIATPEQVVEAVEKLRTGEAVMCFPYNGRFYSCDKISTDLYKTFHDIEVLNKNILVMQLMHGYHSSGGAFIVNRKQYIAAGGENENIYGWGLEDAERLKRMETLNLPVFKSKGPLFHLWHPKVKNSWFANAEIERQNRRELLKTCKITSI